jgi:hypothetical protein
MTKQHIRLSDIAARKWVPISGMRPVARLFGSQRQHILRLRAELDLRREDLQLIGAALAAQAALSGLIFLFFGQE